MKIVKTNSQFVNEYKLIEDYTYKMSFEEYCEIRKTINSGFRIAKCDETVGLFVSDTIGWRIAAKKRYIPFVYNDMFININKPFWKIIYISYK